MGVLVGGVAGSSSRLGGGLSSSPLMVSDVGAMAQQRTMPTLNPTAPGTTQGRFRRHLTGITTDATNVSLGGATVKIFDAATDLKVADVVSDAAGVYDVAIYAEGATYWEYTRKAGSPNVYGASDILTPV